MKKEVGVWIDHRKAVIVTVTNKSVTTRLILSNMEKHVRFSGGGHAHPTGHSQPGSEAEDMRDRQYDEHLDQYYDGLIAIIRTAETIWILGPGEAKIELENRLKHAGLGARIEGIETADKLTDRQITAKVRGHFLKGE
jgi:hypothetical protein